jgi:integrase
MSRKQATRWLNHLLERGHAPATRVNTINQVRAYLRALNDAGLLEVAGDELLRASDLPKLPVYLPRPFPPATDLELQRRLAASPHPFHQGLFVMRNTGLRVGELTGLTLDCVREDELGNTFLKVPLGKLNTERLVPLNARTLAAIEALQRTGRPSRELLLETTNGCRTRGRQMQLALLEVAAGLASAGLVRTHRLRHTYATTLLNAGMSLVSIMKLLGHRDYRMTLRYAQLTQETVGKEYREALTQLEARYRTPLTSALPPKLAPGDAIADVIRWVQKRAAGERRRSLVKRLRRIRDDLEGL